MDLGAVLKIAREAAIAAGEFIEATRESGELGLEYKGELNLLTIADTGAERIIVEHIKKHFPDHAILSEESSPTLANLDDYTGPLWIIDPVDGTTNFVHGLPFVGVSIGFALDGSPAVGVVHAPFLGETYTAARGAGAFLNGEPIHASGVESLKKALIATGFPYERDDLGIIVRQVTDVLYACRDLRRFGAASLDICAVAAGRIDGYFETVNSWDMAAGVIIASEAGARVGHFGAPDDSEVIPPDLSGTNLIVAAEGIYERLAALVSGNMM